MSATQKPRQFSSPPPRVAGPPPPPQEAGRPSLQPRLSPPVPTHRRRLGLRPGASLLGAARPSPPPAPLGAGGRGAGDRRRRRPGGRGGAGTGNPRPLPGLGGRGGAGGEGAGTAPALRPGRPTLGAAARDETRGRRGPRRPGPAGRGRRPLPDWPSPVPPLGLPRGSSRGFSMTATFTGRSPRAHHRRQPVSRAAGRESLAELTFPAPR